MAPSWLGRVDGFLAVAHSRFSLIYANEKRTGEWGSNLLCQSPWIFSLHGPQRQADLLQLSYFLGRLRDRQSQGGPHGPTLRVWMEREFPGAGSHITWQCQTNPCGSNTAGAQGLESELHTTTINIKGSRHGRREWLSEAEVY